jgi:hypothetical protein
MTIDGPFPNAPNTVVVTATFTGINDIPTTVDNQFDILASC